MNKSSTALYLALFGLALLFGAVEYARKVRASGLEELEPLEAQPSEQELEPLAPLEELEELEPLAPIPGEVGVTPEPAEVVEEVPQ